MDTRAEVTAISGETYKLLGSPLLNQPNKVLYGPVQQALNVLGQFSGWLKHGKRSAQETVYVVQGLKTNLLGLQAMTALRLLRRVHATDIDESVVVKQFPDVFQGLGMSMTLNSKRMLPHTHYTCLVTFQYPFDQR